MSYQEVGFKRWKRRAVEQMFKPLEEIEIREVRRQEEQPINNGFSRPLSINSMPYTEAKVKETCPTREAKVCFATVN